MPEVHPALLRGVAGGANHQIEVAKSIAGVGWRRERIEGSQNAQAVIRGEVDRPDDEGQVGARAPQGDFVTAARGQAAVTENVIPCRDKDPDPALCAPFRAGAAG